MLHDCTQPIVDAIDRVHNLLDASLNGIERSVVGTGEPNDPYVYTPPLAQVASPSNYHSPSLRYDTDAFRWLQENFINGTTSVFAPGEAVPNTKLERIAVAVEALGELDDDQLEQLIQIVSILGAV